MPDDVKPKRRYHSPRRREQAEATRVEILEAAARLFIRDGYGPTTMAAIAREAGVASKTVYLAFESKGGLLRALWNLRLRGGREEVPIVDQEWYRETLDEPDAERQLRLNARNSVLGKSRIGALGDVIRSASPLDPDIAALWERINSNYHENQQRIVKKLHEKGALKPELDVVTATDILWTINHPTVWHLLVTERGWTPDQYERWTGDAACKQLLA